MLLSCHSLLFKLRFMRALHLRAYAYDLDLGWEEVGGMKPREKTARRKACNFVMCRGSLLSLSVLCLFAHMGANISIPLTCDVRMQGSRRRAPSLCRYLARYCTRLMILHCFCHGKVAVDSKQDGAVQSSSGPTRRSRKGTGDYNNTLRSTTIFAHMVALRAVVVPRCRL